MAAIGSLIINVAANAQEMKKGLDNARGMMGDFKAKIGQMFPGGDLLASGGFGAGFAASSALVHRQTGAIADQFKELQAAARAMQTDVATAFELKGLKGNQFEAIGPAVAALQKNLGEAAMGSEAARKKFDDLGLSWKELVQSPLREQLRVVAERAKEAASASERAAIANDLLGKGGKELIPTLVQGAAAFDKAADKQFRFISQSELLKAGAMEKVVKEETEVWGKTWDKAIEAARIKFRAWQLDVANYGRGLLGKDQIAPLAKETPGQLPFQPRELNAGEKQFFDALAASAKDYLGIAERLREQREQLQLGPDEAMIAAFQRRNGMNEEAVAILRKEIEATRELQRAHENMKGVENILGGIVGQLNAIGGGPSAQAIRQLQEMGATAQQLAAAREAFDAMRQAQAFQGHREPGTFSAQLKGSSEELSSRNRLQQGLQFKDAHARLQEEANKHLKEHTEKLEKIVKELQGERKPKVVAMN